jgi:hypothetical protein
MHVEPGLMASRMTPVRPKLAASPMPSKKVTTWLTGRVAGCRRASWRVRTGAVKHAASPRVWSPPRSALAGFRFPAEVIVVAVRWYLRYG